jgi:hypothetical protein
MPSNEIGHDREADKGRHDGRDDSIPEYKKAAGFTFEDAREEQAELEALIRKYDGNFQKAVDAQRRGEKPDNEEPSSQNW